MSNRFCWLLASGNEMEHLVPASKQPAESVSLLPDAVCIVLDSWWRTERPSETCRVLLQNKISLRNWCKSLVFTIEIYHDARGRIKVKSDIFRFIHSLNTLNRHNKRIRIPLLGIDRNYTQVCSDRWGIVGGRTYIARHCIRFRWVSRGSAPGTQRRIKESWKNLLFLRKGDGLMVTRSVQSGINKRHGDIHDMKNVVAKRP